MPPFLELIQDHKSGSYIPYSLLTSTGKMQETRPTDFHSYLRRLASLNVISKEAHSPQLNLRCWVLFQSGASTFDLPHGSPVRHFTILARRRLQQVYCIVVF